jgi:phage minor structural protein
LDIYDNLKYDVYEPVYNDGACKVRSITAKESNYFNILQTIAETFEQWLVINIDRNNDGSIKPNGKTVAFRNYRGDNNYACFRYGVNLKDIQRTYASKNIVSKLVVKPNTNELGTNGFCTI